MPYQSRLTVRRPANPKCRTIRLTNSPIHKMTRPISFFINDPQHTPLFSPPLLWSEHSTTLSNSIPSRTRLLNSTLTDSRTATFSSNRFALTQFASSHQVAHGAFPNKKNFLNPELFVFILIWMCVLGKTVNFNKIQGGALSSVQGESERERERERIIRNSNEDEYLGEPVS